MGIKIIKPGVFTSIQDAGRTGYRSSGIGPGGAMDPFAGRVANYLVGNEDHSALIETGFPAPEIRFMQDAFMAITGADLSPMLDNNPVTLWKPVLAKKDAVLSFNKPVSGQWTYIAVAGGWKIQSWLGSHSTNLAAEAGGYKGRKIGKDDELGCLENMYHPSVFSQTNGRLSEHELHKIYSPGYSIRCMPSVEWQLMDVASMNAFQSDEFQMGSQSDRMGYRLSGPPLGLTTKEELISSAVDAGTIQLLPDGNLVVLMADHQTTGGYARIASVIKTDLPKLAQLVPGGKIRFSLVSREEAENTLLQMERSMKEIRAGSHLNMEKFRTA